MAPEGRVAPSGQAAAAWTLTVLRRDGDSETSVCQLADVSHLWLTDDRVKVPLVIAQTDSRRINEVAAARLLSEQPPSERIEVPIDVITACRITDCDDGHDTLLRSGLGSIGATSVRASLWELGLLLLVGLLTASLLYTSPLHELSLALREPTRRGSP